MEKPRFKIGDTVYFKHEDYNDFASNGVYIVKVEYVNDGFDYIIENNLREYTVFGRELRLLTPLEKAML